MKEEWKDSVSECIFCSKRSDVRSTSTVEPLYNVHFGTKNFVRYTEVSITQRVERSHA